MTFIYSLICIYYKYKLNSWLCFIHSKSIMYYINSRNCKSEELLINNGVSNFIWLYEIHNDDEIIFIIENTKEYGFVDFLVYNKYIKINLPDMEIEVAEYAMTNSVVIFILYR